MLLVRVACSRRGRGRSWHGRRALHWIFAEPAAQATVALSREGEVARRGALHHFGGRVGALPEASGVSVEGCEGFEGGARSRE